jgi:hypothetical protein
MSLGGVFGSHITAIILIFDKQLTTPLLVGCHESIIIFTCKIAHSCLVTLHISVLELNSKFGVF